MVNAENMQKWIDALRSGEYTKIKGHLEGGDGYNCAEGVACREAIRDGVKVSVATRSSGETVFDGEAAVAPLAVLAWLGLDDNPVIDSIKVVRVNDRTNQTFADIADGLYRQYLKEPKTDG